MCQAFLSEETTEYYLRFFVAFFFVAFFFVAFFAFFFFAIYGSFVFYLG